jgi:DNA-binding Xre family transcriptional regulator
MTKIPLPQYLEQPGNSQALLAAAVGITQGAISKMKLSGRNVFVLLSEAGEVLELVEEKSITSSSAA